MVGSLVLQPAQVSLASEDRELLKQGIEGRLAFDATLPAVELDPATRATLATGVQVGGVAQLQATAIELARAAEALQAVMAKYPAKGFALDEQTDLLIRQLVSSIRGGQGPTSPGLAEAIGALREQMAAWPKKDAELPTKWRDELTALRNAVDRVAPRQNIRGQAEVQK